MGSNLSESAKRKTRTRSKKKSHNILLIIVLSLTIVLLYLGFRTYSNQQKNREPSQNVNNDDGVVFSVTTINAGLDSITDYIDVNGNVVSQTSVEIFPDTKGILDKIYRSVGDFVQINQVIAEIDPSRPGEKFALSPVRARIAGTITSLKLDQGDLVTPQTPVAVIDDLRLLQIISHVPEKFISRIFEGMSAEVEILSMPGRTLYLNVNKVNPTVDPVRRSLELRINIPESAHQDVKVGMYAQVRLVAEIREGVISLPVDSVLRGETEHVYVIEDGVARKRDVRLGLTLGNKVEIVEGVESGEEIATRGQSRLGDGVKVHIISSADTKEN